MRKTVAYVLSTPYAGSHYLSLMMGSNSRAIHVGELNLVRKEKAKKESRECIVNGIEILEGINAENCDRIHDIIFSRIDPGIQVLVDNSKKVSWAELFLDHDAFDKKYIHLIRDPRALVRRYALHSYFRKVWRHRWRVFKAIPEMRTRIYLLAEPYVWCYYWLVQNRAITRFLRDHQLEHTVVTYRDLAVNPATEIRRLMEWLGLSYEPAQLEYWNFEHIGTQKREYEWVKEKKATFIDLRWQSELAADVQQTIRKDRLIGEYLSALGLKFMDDGLTRNVGTPADAPLATSVGLST
jgi:hypothetical protein